MPIELLDLQEVSDDEDACDNDHGGIQTPAQRQSAEKGSEERSTETSPTLSAFKSAQSRFEQAHKQSEVPKRQTPDKKIATSIQGQQKETFAPKVVVRYTANSLLAESTPQDATRRVQPSVKNSYVGSDGSNRLPNDIKVGGSDKTEESAGERRNLYGTTQSSKKASDIIRGSNGLPPSKSAKVPEPLKRSEENSVIDIKKVVSKLDFGAEQKVNGQRTRNDELGVEYQGRSVSAIRDTFIEKRGGEGGLAAALKGSRTFYMQLVSRVEEMKKKVRRLDSSNERNLRNARGDSIAMSPEKEQELSDLNKVIAISIDKCWESVQEFGAQQEEAEKCLNRANSAILSRMNHADNAGASAASGNRALIRDERSRVTAFLATIDAVRVKQSEYESELEKLLDLKSGLLSHEPGIASESSVAIEGSGRIRHVLPTHTSQDDIISKVDNINTGEGERAPQADLNPTSHAEASQDDTEVSTSCFSPMKGKAVPKSSFSQRKTPQGFAFNDPDVVFQSKVGNADPKPASSSVRATLFFSPFSRASRSPAPIPAKIEKHPESPRQVQNGVGNNSPPSSRPDSGSIQDAPIPDRSTKSSKTLMQKAATKFTKALTSCEKQVASQWSKLFSEPPLIAAAIKDQVDKISQFYETEGLDALCHAVQASGWTVAHYAAHHGSMKTLEFLASAAPRLFNQRDRKGNTPAHIAAARNQKQVLRLLHRHMRASFAVQNNAGKLPVNCGDGQSRALLDALESNHGGPITADVLATGRTFLRKTGINLA